MLWKVRASFLHDLDAFLVGLPTLASRRYRKLSPTSCLCCSLIGTLRNNNFTNMATYSTEAPLLDTYQAVVSAYSDFLIVAIHTILYERNIYPQTSFIKARKYNYPVRQSRHPKLCKWIMDAVAAVEVEMLKVKMALISVMIEILGEAVHHCSLCFRLYMSLPE